jgi:hypothetical protein
MGVAEGRAGWGADVIQNKQVQPGLMIECTAKGTVAEVDETSIDGQSIEVNSATTIMHPCSVQAQQGSVKQQKHKPGMP